MSNNLPQFLVNRDTETASVTRFLANKAGGILLLGGDRGSGKTTLVKTAIDKTLLHPWKDERRIKKAWTWARSWSRSKVVYVQIPLIIISPSQSGDNPRNIEEQYRSLLMRAMLMGMEADLLRRYEQRFGWLDLPQRWFRSIGYIQKVYALRPYSHYLSLNKTTSRALSGPSSLAASPTVQSALNAEIDLSDSSLEIKLRDLLSGYSKLHNFVFLFDELDKLPSDVKLESLVLYMKNLFAETGVHAIFVTDESSLTRIMAKAAETPPTELSTLFVNHLLLNNMSRLEFGAAVKMSVDAIPENSLALLVAVLSLRTRRSPYELSKVLAKYGRSYNSLMQGLKSDLGTEIVNNYSAMQLFIDYVADLYASQHEDAYFKRTLTSILGEVGSTLLNNGSHYLDIHNPLSLLTTTDLFGDPESTPEEAQQKEAQYKNSSPLPGEALALPSVMVGMLALSADQQVSIRYAVECLLTLLNRNGNLTITAPSEYTNLLTITGIRTPAFQPELINTASFDSQLTLIPSEQKALKILHTYRASYFSITRKEVYGDDRFVAPDDVDNLEGQGKYSLANSMPQWLKLTILTRDIQNRLFSVFFGRVNKFAENKYTKYNWYRNSATVLLENGNRYQVITLFGRQRARVNNSAIKTFIIRDSSSTAKPLKPTAKIRNLQATTNWANVDSIAKNIAEWVDQHSA